MCASFCTSGAGAKARGGFIASAISLLIGSLGTAVTFVGPEQKEQKRQVSGRFAGDALSRRFARPGPSVYLRCSFWPAAGYGTR